MECNFQPRRKRLKWGWGSRGFWVWGSGGPEQYSWSAITTNKQAILGHNALPQEIPQRSLCFFPIFFLQDAASQLLAINPLKAKSIWWKQFRYRWRSTTANPTAQKKGNQTILSPTSPPFFVWFLPKLLGILWAGQGRRFEGGWIASPQQLAAKRNSLSWFRITSIH